MDGRSSRLAVYVGAITSESITQPRPTRRIPDVIQEPTQPTLTPNPTPRPQRIGGVRIGLVIAAIILVAIPVVVAVASNFAPVSSPLAIAGASAAPDANGKPDAHGPKADKGPKGGGPGKGPITIKSISGSSLQLGTVDGWSRVINVTSTTVITKGGQTIAVGDLKAGDEIHFRQIRNDDGSFSIVAIDVPTPHAGGTVTKVDGNDITVSKKDGTTQVITVTGSTVYKMGSVAGSKGDVKVGVNIDAQGTVSGTTFTATAVNIKPAHLDGEVTAKTSNSITVKAKDGTTKTIHVSGTTTYRLPGATTSSCPTSRSAIGSTPRAPSAPTARSMRTRSTADRPRARSPRSRTRAPRPAEPAPYLLGTRPRWPSVSGVVLCGGRRGAPGPSHPMTL